MKRPAHLNSVYNCIEFVRHVLPLYIIDGTRRPDHFGQLVGLDDSFEVIEALVGGGAGVDEMSLVRSWIMTIARYILDAEVHEVTVTVIGIEHDDLSQRL